MISEFFSLQKSIVFRSTRGEKKSKNFAAWLIVSRQSINLLRVSPSPWNLRWFCRLTFHALRCVLFPSGHLRPSGICDYPCSLQFSSPWLRSVGPQKKVKRSKTPRVSLKYLRPGQLSGIVHLLFRHTTLAVIQSARVLIITTSSCLPTIRSSSVTQLSRSSSFYAEFTSPRYL